MDFTFCEIVFFSLISLFRMMRVVRAVKIFSLPVFERLKINKLVLQLSKLVRGEGGRVFV